MTPKRTTSTSSSPVRRRPSSNSLSPSRRKGLYKNAWGCSNLLTVQGLLAEQQVPQERTDSGVAGSLFGEAQHDAAGYSTPRFPLSPSRKPKFSQLDRRMAAHSSLMLLLDPEEDTQTVSAVAEGLLFDSLPSENVQSLKTTVLHNNSSSAAFLTKLQHEGWDLSRVCFAWHLAGSAAAAKAIQSTGIRCEDEHCHCGRYGRGGYVATCAAKANAYSDSEGNGGERHMFLVLIFPDEDVVRGERGTRPVRTAADLPSHPTEYCFVEQSRLHCVCRLDYAWVPTGRRPKVATAGGHVRAWRSNSRVLSPPRRSECALEKRGR